MFAYVERFFWYQTEDLRWHFGPFIYVFPAVFFATLWCLSAFRVPDNGGVRLPADGSAHAVPSGVVGPEAP